MAKVTDFDWRIPVPQLLLAGSIFDRWTETKEDRELENNCLFKVDDHGFFIYWKSYAKEGEVIDLSQITDVRPGGVPQDPKLYGQLERKYGDNFEEKSLTICWGNDYVNIQYQHVLAIDVETSKTWLQGLRLLTHNIKANNVCPRTSLLKLWTRLHLKVDPRGKLPIRSIIKTFSGGKSEKAICQALKDLDLPDGKTACIEKNDLPFAKFVELNNSLCPRTDIEEIFRQIVKDCPNNEMGVEALAGFLNGKQRDPRLNEILHPIYNEARCTEIINAYESDKEKQKNKILSLNGFIQYLMSDGNSPVFLNRFSVFQDMDQPLAHYFINSSHNTYLTGRQFGGKSSVEMYRQVLLAGCRCIELDCWDGADDEPIITHGMAMCTDIAFKDVIYAIRDCAFVTSEFPVILSFENHCCRDQQLKMAEYLAEILGDLLCKEALPNHPLKPGQPLPSPSALKRKILIKNNKMTPENEKAQMALFLSGELNTTGDVKEDANAIRKPSPELLDPVKPKKKNKLLPVVPEHIGSTTNLHPRLSALVVYTQPSKFDTFEKILQRDLHYNISSFSETKALNLMKENACELVDLTKRNLIRIYPKDTRADSSNYMPQVFWNAGCQMVALNFQTPDLPLQLNQGMFEYNGNCGYILKPEFLRRKESVFNPFSYGPIDGIVAVTCTVRVLSGAFLTDHKVGTFVEVDLFGLPSDTTRKEFRTRTVPANGLNPHYNEDPFIFTQVLVPKLAMIRFGVYDEMENCLGQRILPLDALQSGYRHISLRTEGSIALSQPSLFCEINITILVPDELETLALSLTDPTAVARLSKIQKEKLSALGIEMASPLDKKAGITDDKQQFSEITVDTLLLEKSFEKFAKRNSKELDTIAKKQIKERMGLQKSHFSRIAKFMRGKNKKDFKSNPDFGAAVQSQNEEWRDVIGRHRKERWATLKKQLLDQEEVLKKIMTGIQASNEKQLKEKHLQEIKRLTTTQIKKNAEMCKEVETDKSLKTKGARSKRLREQKKSCRVMFADEKTDLVEKQVKERDELKAAHEKQVADFENEVKLIIGAYDLEEEEQQMCAEKEFFA